MRLGQIRRRRAGADEQMLHALAGQEHRSGQSRAAAAHDQNRNFFFIGAVKRHRASSTSRNWSEYYNSMNWSVNSNLRYRRTMAVRADVTPNRRGMKSRELVLDAAERVMAEHGFEAATLARVVEEAGIPMSSVYHYYGSKDGILLAVMERGAERFFDDLPDPNRRLGRPRNTWPQSSRPRPGRSSAIRTSSAC